MALTINGRMTGRAASTELAEQRAELYERELAEQGRIAHETQVLVEKIEVALDSQYMDWLDTTPDDNAGFLQACKDKWAELEGHAIDMATDAEREYIAQTPPEWPFSASDERDDQAQKNELTNQL